MAEFSLNDEQRPAVDRHDRNLLLSAGAGSGKTRVLVERYLKILEDSDWDLTLPPRILAITFTEKAALEMRERIMRSLEKRASGVERELSTRLVALVREMESAPISTIHGFCSRLLRENATEAGLDPRFAIPGEVELHELKRSVIAALYAEDDPDLLATVGELGADNVRQALDEIRELRRSLGLSRADLSPDRAGTLAATHEKQALSILTNTHLAWRGKLSERFAGLCSHLPGGIHPSEKMQGKIDLARARLAIVKRDELVPDLSDGLIGDMTRFSGKGKKIDDNGRLASTWDRLKAEIKNEGGLLRLLADPRSEAVGRPGDLNAAFLRLLGRYCLRLEREMDSRGWLDFEDLQLRAADLLEGNPDTATRYRKLFIHVLVDEFQDTNHLQLKLVRLLVPGMGDDESRLFLVGDERQSIYSFRNADVEVFRGERERMGRQGAAATLRYNYRSHPALMDLFNAFFPHATFPPMEAKREVAPDPAGADPRVLVQVTPQFDTEADATKGAAPSGRSRTEARLAAARALARTLKSVHDAGLAVGDGRPVEWSDIAILLRSGTDIGLLALALTEQGIPHEASGGRDYLIRRELRDLEDLLAALEDPWHRLKLARGLRGDIIGLDTADLLAVLPSAPRRGAGRDRGEALAACEEIAAGQRIAPGLSEDGRRRLARFLALKRRFAGRLFRLPLRTLILELIEAADFDLLAATGPRALRVQRNLRQMADLVLELEGGRRLGVREFLDLMERLREVAPKREEAWVPEEGESLVRILTIHSSKGLEFPLLVVADLDREIGRNEALEDIAGLRIAGERPGDNDAPLGICWRDIEGERYPDPVHVMLSRVRKERDSAENLRLLYVALTRAQDYLILSGILADADPQTARTGFREMPANPGASFMNRVREAVCNREVARCCRISFTDRDEVWLPGPTVARATEESSQSSGAPQDEAARNWSRLTGCFDDKGKLEIPVTSLGLLQNCPLRWLLERRFGLAKAGFAGDAWIPAEGSEPHGPGGADFGSTLHLILERWDFTLPAPEAFAAACPAGLPDDVREETERLLIPVFSAKLPWPERLRRGTNFRREESFILNLDDVTLIGQTDLVFEEGGQRFLVDWKSDRVEGREAITRRVEHHQYQIALYAMALRAAGLPVQQAVLCFVRQANPFRQVQIDDKSLVWAERRIRHLGNLAFELTRISSSSEAGLIDRIQGPGKQPPCQACPFKGDLCTVSYRTGRRES
ncbi:MAG: UvrD-helicase domain-containing protein [bacterium]|nr:UvrD-helicase domain-containing protein [bacterium]